MAISSGGNTVVTKLSEEDLRKLRAKETAALEVKKQAAEAIARMESLKINKNTKGEFTNPPSVVLNNQVPGVSGGGEDINISLPYTEEQIEAFELAAEESNSKLPKDNPFSPDYERPEPKAKDVVTDYECLEFDNSVEFLAFFDNLISNRHRNLYEWQAWCNQIISDKRHTIEDPLELFIVAANGSGKDAYVIAPPVVFLLCCRIRSRTVITTKDYKQMMMQTYPYIASFCEQVNKKLREIGLVKDDEPDFIRVKQGHITCEKTGSEIVMFVTDEPGRAEGYHPFPDYPYSELTILVNEAKNVLKEIFQALRRCTGFCRFICVSSAGFDNGYFYDNVCSAVNYPAPYDKSRSYVRYITSYDCPHVSPKVIAKDKETLEPWLFGSIHESRFSSLGGKFIVPRQSILKLKLLPQVHRDINDICGGLDLSLGGDRCKFYLRRGNKVTEEMEWSEKEPSTLSLKISRYLKSLKLPPKTKINVDAGGIGNPISKILRQDIKEITWILVHNNKPAFRKAQFRSKGTEDYFHIRSLVAFGLITAVYDDELIAQLASRRYILTDQKLKVEDKEDHIAREGESPDLADAFVLCYRDYKVNQVLQMEKDAEDNTYKLVKQSVENGTAECIDEEGRLTPGSKNFDFYAYRKHMAEIRKKNTMFGKRSKSINQILNNVYGNTDESPKARYKQLYDSARRGPG